MQWQTLADMNCDSDWYSSLEVQNETIHSPTEIVQAVVEHIVSDHVPSIAAAADEVDRLDDIIYAFDPSAHPLKRMGAVHRELMHLRHMLKRKAVVVASLMDDSARGVLHAEEPAVPLDSGAAAQERWRDKVVTHINSLTDTYNNVTEMQRIIGQTEETLRSLENAHMAHVSMHAAEQANNMNAEMKRISSIATILLPHTLFAGLLGMNVTVPGQIYSSDKDGWDALLPFSGIFLSFLGIGLFLTVYFKRNGLL
jgi:Mg2+ and Co2+ transporter CorA